MGRCRLVLESAALLYGWGGDVDFVFFFQAEDGIRDSSVTGVQTCALPISFSVSLVAAALVWQWIYDPVYGVLNHVLAVLGVPPLRWLQSLDLVRPSLALVNVWARLGFDTMIFLAALQAVPAEYYGAAAIAGAGAWPALWRINLPPLK